ncbi:hypothetical protein [Amycolatopsis sp. FDAARGOS 1241]|uniref:hypothetical protein n=1 Tax=Amycolatopsis sp. FDAARGOS 1241 TaxID=2778070 RepID=UPI00195043B2|nr:hypothetical protein [Amycolatopsis sp. FDAARGOS 1241]QRP48652.1 hypothetical protein I6J71_12965 [Amycolatopsis sp. FDAARGOS 1241]
MRALVEYDRLGPNGFFAAHGFGASRAYEFVWRDRRYPHNAVPGTAYEFATGERLAPADFEGGRSGAVKVLEKLGFSVVPRAAKQEQPQQPTRATAIP